MRIGIITYHRAKNLGAMLQSYALQKIVENKVGECEIIDYRNEKLEDNYRIKKIRQEKGIKNKIKNILYKNKNKKFEKVRDNFLNDYQKVSNKVYNEKTINQANNEYDLYIAGSDQVWNPNLNYRDKNYFLGFVSDNSKRNSYAASFGTNSVNDEDKVWIKKELEKFNNISVREEEGKKIVKDLINKNASVVLDPTLLLNYDEWKEIMPKECENKEKYIFVYLIAYTPTILEFARKFAKEKGYKIICFHNTYHKYKGMENLKELSPNKFLYYIKNAEYVITSSFHGLCFAINFHKKFFYELDEAKKNNNSRLVTLTKMLELENRKIVKGNCSDNEIDFSKVEEKLNEERKNSIKFICKLGGNKNE